MHVLDVVQSDRVVKATVFNPGIAADVKYLRMVNDLWEFFGPKVVDEGGFQLVVAEKGEDHAIFFGYVPLEDSTGRSYAAVVFSSKKLLENARRAFEYYGSGLVVTTDGKHKTVSTSV